MMHHIAAQILVDDRHRELRKGVTPRSRPPSPPRRWTRPGRR
ncbi:MAG TPA: hypothetical protein VJM49_05940 [Acidimicrobiales bacterium]|nr:hypothetical protein [Acidimicrobiales bacterium]